MRRRRSQRATSGGARSALAERFPLLRPFPMTVFAVGAIMLAVAALAVGAPTPGDGSSAQAGRVAQAPAAQTAPVAAGGTVFQALVVSSDDE